MIKVHWCNNVIRDYSSIREVSHLRYRYWIGLRFGISCRWCHNSSSGGGTKGDIRNVKIDGITRSAGCFKTMANPSSEKITCTAIENFTKFIFCK